MKRGIFTSVCFSLFLISCTKHDQIDELLGNQPGQQVFASAWEPVASNTWQGGASDGMHVYSYRRALPQLTSGVMNDGTVIVYAKGYGFGEPVGSRPMSLPFMFYTGSEQQSVPYAWEMNNTPGNVQISLRMTQGAEGIFLTGRDGVALQYFVLPKEFLLKHNLTKQSASKLSYNQLTELIASVK